MLLDRNLKEIFKALSDYNAKQKPKKKTQTQIDKEKHEKERKLWETAEENKEEEWAQIASTCQGRWTNEVLTEV